MRQYLVILALSAFTMSGNSFADHNGGNYNFAAAANYAYQLADIGESYSGAYNYQLSNAANTMHHAATNLFYALKNKSGGGYPLFDHQEGGIEVIHQMVAQVGYTVDSFVRLAPYRAGSRALSLFNTIRYQLGC